MLFREFEITKEITFSVSSVTMGDIFTPFCPCQRNYWGDLRSQIRQIFQFSLRHIIEEFQCFFLPPSNKLCGRFEIMEKEDLYLKSQLLRYILVFFNH